MVGTGAYGILLIERSVGYICCESSALAFLKLERRDLRMLPVGENICRF